MEGLTLDGCEFFVFEVYITFEKLEWFKGSSLMSLALGTR